MDKLHKDYVYFEEINYGLLKHIGKKLTILDVGCGYGVQGEAMRGKENKVFGIDISNKAIEKAITRLNFAAVADITRTETIPETILKQKFDLIVLADILEHVYDPMQIILSIKPFLKPEGKIVISVPNIANWCTRLLFLFGRWEYTVSGVLDRTHIRFFTLKTFKRLIHASNLKIVKITATPYFTRAFAVLIRNVLFPESKNKIPSDPSALMKLPFYRFYLNYVFPIETFFAQLWKSLFAFQFVLTAQINDTVQPNMESIKE